MRLWWHRVVEYKTCGRLLRFLRLEDGSMLAEMYWPICLQNASASIQGGSTTTGWRAGLADAEDIGPQGGQDDLIDCGGAGDFLLRDTAACRFV